MPNVIVAIDGGAGSGKSTTAKGVARELKFFYLDTGAMYRAATLKYLRCGGKEPVDMGLVHEIIDNTRIDLKVVNDDYHVYLDGKDVSLDVRMPAVNNMVSPISAIREVREWMVELQRLVARGKNVVCEGRDIGTVVFPDARVKIFMFADLKVRAQRRVKECAEKEIPTTLDDVVENLRYRDEYDSGRQHSPLRKADDAIEVDTTRLTIEEEIDLVKKIVLEKISSTEPSCGQH
jgi:cytidylate kinase